MQNDEGQLDPFVEGVLRRNHPSLEGIPDYGLVLEPEEEALFRSQAVAGGVNFDELKRTFELSCQVIPAQSNRQTARVLIENRIIPLNSVKDYFQGRLDMAITIKNTPNFWNRRFASIVNQ